MTSVAPPIDPTPSDSDAGLVDALRAGDEAAFRSLIQRHQATMVRVARSFVKSHAVAEEVAQETWVAVLSGLERFEERSTVRTWIFRILVKRAISRAQKEGRSVPLSVVGGDDPSVDPVIDPSRFSRGKWASPDVAPKKWNEDTPEKLALSAEAREVIERSVEDLPLNQRAVITMRDIEGWESKDVCNVLEISETNQRVLLHRARGKVRAALEEYLDPGSAS